MSLALTKRQGKIHFHLDAVRDNDIFNRKSMDVFIHKIRRYLDQDPSVKITNVHGKGFVLEVN